MVGENKLFLTLKYLFLIIISFIILIPIFLTILGSFKSLAQLRLNFLGFPNPVVWKNYTDILNASRSFILLYFYNSIFIGSFTVILQLFLSGLAGFAFARFKFRGREFLYNYFIIGIIFPFSAAILPLYIQLRNLHLLNNYFGVILPQVAFGLPTNTIMMRSFFQQIPKEIEEAAIIDGCGNFRLFLHIMLPLSKPILATISGLTMIASWNNFLLPSIVFTNEKLYSIPLGVMRFAGQYLIAWNFMLAYLTLSMIPTFILFLFLQKYIINGFISQSVKG